jgi:hypothetical protein
MDDLERDMIDGLVLKLIESGCHWIESGETSSVSMQSDIFIEGH